MTRPSHWLLISMAVFATVVTATGSWRRVLAGPSVDRWIQQRGNHAVRAVELGQPVELFGVVLDRDGAPLVGAKVELAETGVDAFTDEDGRFGLTAQGRRSHQVAITADGHATVARVAVPGEPVCVVLATATAWSARFETEPARMTETDAATASLLAGEGFVQDDSGRAVPYARVSVRETGAAAFADEHGHYRVPLPADGDVTLIASDQDGRVARSAPFRPSRRHGIVPAGDLVLGEGRVVSGYVRERDGLACAGAIVIAEDKAMRHTAVTDRRGLYVIEGLCADTGYSLTVLPFEGQRSARRHCQTGRESEVDLLLHEVEQRRVRVVHDASGEGFGGAHVAADDGICVVYGRADDEGWVELDGLLPSEVSTAVTFRVRDPELQLVDVKRIDQDTVFVAAP